MNGIARALLAAAVLIGLTGGAAWLAHRPWFDLKRIELRSAGETGLRHVSAPVVRAATAGRISGNFFTVRLDEVRRVFEGVPWVARVSVRRVWPNRLRVTVAEHRAVGLWSDGRLLASDGRLFVANPAEAEVEGMLVQFDGPPQYAAEALRRYRSFSELLMPLGLTITAVDVSDRLSWTVSTASGQRFEMGRDEPAGRLDQRTRLLVASYRSVVERMGEAPTRIDLRYENGLAVVAKAGARPGSARAKKP